MFMNINFNLSRQLQELLGLEPVIKIGIISEGRVYFRPFLKAQS